MPSLGTSTLACCRVAIIAAASTLTSCTTLVPRALPAFHNVTVVEVVTDYTPKLVVEDSDRVAMVRAFINSHRAGWHEYLRHPAPAEVEFRLCNGSRYLGEFWIGQDFVSRRVGEFYWKIIPESELEPFLKAVHPRLIEAQPVTTSTRIPHVRTPNYWSRKLDQQLPNGSTLEEIQTFVREHGAVVSRRSRNDFMNSISVALRRVNSRGRVEKVYGAWLELDDQDQLIRATVTAYSYPIKAGIDPRHTPVYACK